MSAKAKIKITARDIIDLLAVKHKKDVFVTEAKLGSSWKGAKRMDAWAMRRSWSPVAMIGYEVKVSRSDFLNDEKWPEYMANCHEFYFASPYGMIQPEELPEGVGLVWVSKTGTRLFTKRKAPRREITPPADLMVYLLMSRTKIVGDMWEANRKHSSKIDRWRRWIEEQKERKELGEEIRGRIREAWASVNKENRELKRENQKFDVIREQITELGFDPEKPFSTWEVRQRLQDLLRVATPKDKQDLQSTTEFLKSLSEAITEAERC